MTVKLLGDASHQGHQIVGFADDLVMSLLMDSGLLEAIQPSSGCNPTWLNRMMTFQFVSTILIAI